MKLKSVFFFRGFLSIVYNFAICLLRISRMNTNIFQNHTIFIQVDTSGASKCFVRMRICFA